MSKAYVKLSLEGGSRVVDVIRLVESLKESGMVKDVQVCLPIVPKEDSPIYLKEEKERLIC